MLRIGSQRIFGLLKQKGLLSFCPTGLQCLFVCILLLALHSLKQNMELEPGLVVLAGSLLTKEVEAGG